MQVLGLHAAAPEGFHRALTPCCFAQNTPRFWRGGREVLKTISRDYRTGSKPAVPWDDSFAVVARCAPFAASRGVISQPVRLLYYRVEDAEGAS